MMRVAVLIPDRGDRPLFLENCLRMLRAQTLQPNHIEIVNDTPLSEECDITWRYRIGYDRLRNQNFDVIALIENDDWYSPDYLKVMVNKWNALGNPEIFGTNYTIYYHLRLRAYYTMFHDRRASAMNTLLKPDLEHINWPADSDPYTDIWLWKFCLKGFTFKPDSAISIGMKHGVGLCGGLSHTDRLHRYTGKRGQPDNGFLQSTLDPESYNFYSNLFTT
jgi:glycosyltransferase involved in cell wall biosynthesis